ncbi:MAG TPA: phosphodiester glycosidase family protein [Sphingobacteriaceae bacterium]|nr:phosphodiester glycosidase family protein [Sphingobacteriaceae bacterium]
MNIQTSFRRNFIIPALYILLTVQACSKKADTPVPVVVNPPAKVVTIRSPLTKKITDQTTLITTFQSDTLIQIAQGLSQTVITYLNSESKPMKVFILEVDLNIPTLRLKAGTPNNKPAFTKQIMSEIARAQDTVGNRVLAALNGDFYEVATGIPSSALYKGGVAVKPEFCNLCTFLAIDDQNKALILSKDRTFTPSKIREAIGGFHWLIKNSQKVVNGDLSIHPRTAAGVTASNMVYFVLADGRQPAYSNGMSFSQLSDLYFALGVKDAINLDGGGSSTLVVKENSSWIVKNKPSDGFQRAVANGWTIVDVNK